MGTTVILGREYLGMEGKMEDMSIEEVLQDMADDLNDFLDMTGFYLTST